MTSNWNSWDIPSQSFRSGMASNGINSSSFIRSQQYGNNSMINTPLGRVPVPSPPLPPKPSTDNNYNYYNSPGSFYNNFGFGGYPSYGSGYRPGFNSYGYGYGYGSGGYYGGNNPESRFIQLAQESSKPAFDAIQSVLHTFSSVANVFDSIFSALYTSYMSVIGVADSLGRLRSVFGEVFSVWAIFKLIHKLLKRLLFLIGLTKTNPDTEWIWEEALNGSATVNGPEGRQGLKPRSKVLFWCIIASVLGLIQLMSRIFPAKETWNPQSNPGSLAVGMYDFQGRNSDELPFTANQKLMIAPEKFQTTNCPGWLLACNENKKMGLIPSNYIGMVMVSEKTGKTYIEHNGQKYPSVVPEEDPSKKVPTAIPGTSKDAEEALPKNDNQPENNATE